MSLDAGTVKGKLSLDTTEFNEGFKEAHTHAESEGGHIREVLESIAEVASEVAGPAFAQMGQQVQSAFAGFSEGPVIGTLNLVGLPERRFQPDVSAGRNRRRLRSRRRDEGAMLFVGIRVL